MSLVGVSAGRHDPDHHPQAIELGDLDRGILAAVAYADVFDFPLTADEIHRYLVGVTAEGEQVRQALAEDRLVPRFLSRVGGYYSLPGRESTVALRQRRAPIAAALWPRALFYGRLIASLPFVRMVAVTGELAVDNADVHSDIDYFIVTEPGRLWLCRAMAVALVRAAGLRGDMICPNYLLSERALVLENRSLYTAHELVQMVPIAGSTIYQRIRELNSWSDDFLPNASGPPREIRCLPLAGPVRRTAERALRTAVGSRLEYWEMTRKIRKLSTGRPEPQEVAFSPEWCKGHFDGHGRRTLAAYHERLHRVENRVR